MIHPDAYIARPLGYLCNQIGHVAAGYGGVWLLVEWRDWDVPRAVLVVLAICVAIEIWQLLRRDGLLWDSAEDLAFEVSGIAAAAASHWLLVPVPLFVAAGVARRVDERKQVVGPDDLCDRRTP